MHGPIGKLLETILESIFRASATKTTYPDHNVVIRDFENVTEFWRAVQQRNLMVEYVRMEGAVSTFAPAMPGHPKRKRDIHRYIRRHYDDILAQLNQHGHSVGKTTLDALLAYSSGQMVMKLEPEDTPYIYMGFYHSIVRNSIPLFVKRRYFEEVIKYTLRRNKSSEVIEARVVARVLPISESYLEKYLRGVGLYQVFDSKMIAELTPGFTLQVDGDDGRTYVESTPTRLSRYLDGDIWIALTINGVDRVVSRFLDLSDPADLVAERNALKSDVESLYPGAHVISEYDQQEPLFPIHSLDPTDIAERVYRDLTPPQKHAKGEGSAARIGPKYMPVRVERLEGDLIVVEGGVAMSDEHINIHNVGGIVNVKATLTNAKQIIGGAQDLADDRRKELMSLMDQLQSALEVIRENRPEEAERVAQTAELVASEAAKQKPSKSFLKITTDGLKEAAKALEDIAPSVIEIAIKIAAALL